MNRRSFLQTTALATASTSLIGAQALSAAETKGVNWPIGCFNRPWLGDKNKWGFDVALDGIKAAGYKSTGLLTRTPKEALLGSDATPEYLSGLKQKIAEHGLKAVMGALRTKNDLPLDEQIKDLRKQIDNGKTVGVEYLLTFGVNDEAHLANYLKLIKDAAAYSQDNGMRLVLKPHGGESSGADEILNCLEKVNHPNFKIWFDAGNIIFYTGRDPVEQLRKIAKEVTGFCAKDCDKQKGSVFLEFGKGKVDFPAVFAELKKAGYNGPVMVECCALGETPEIVTANARKNREYLEKVFASL